MVIRPGPEIPVGLLPDRAMRPGVMVHGGLVTLGGAVHRDLRCVPIRCSRYEVPRTV